MRKTRWPCRDALRLAIVVSANAAAAGCSQTTHSLAERIDEARVEAPDGRYAAFLPTVANGGLVGIAEGSPPRPAFTPPFPAKLSLVVTVPQSGRFVFSPAIVTRQEVRRALVEFVVRVDDRVVFAEAFDYEDANLWHERSVDLSAFSGREVTLALETRPFRGGADKLWADRVQTVWGEPMIVRSTDLFVDVADSARGLEAWLERNGPDGSLDVATAFGFGINLVIGGILALVIRALYRRLESTAPDVGAFSNLFPLFTLSTILVITVVENSLALSLGLLGALSIVRFRSSIKTPGELVYLLFCVAVGLTLGAGERALAVLAVAFIALVEVARSRLLHLRFPDSEVSFVVTLSGDTTHFFRDGEPSVLAGLRDPTLAARVRFQRLDREGDRMELRTVVSVDARRDRELPASLRRRFPDLEISCVDADAVL